MLADKPDDYYGDIAANYDASRSHKEKWRKEIEAVSRFVWNGPVLDVPLGTGRFVPIYRARGLKFTGVDISSDMLAQAFAKHGPMDAICGSVFDMPFRPGKFATAVCVRFLEWLPLDEAKRVIGILRRLAPTLVISITHGVEGKPEAYTYDFGKFLSVLDGLLIEGRQVTADVRGMTSEIYKLRPARWDDVEDQFRFDHGAFPDDEIQRIADKHAASQGLPPIPVRHNLCSVRCEYWHISKIKGLLAELSKSEPLFTTDDKPRRTDKPLTVLQRDGKELLLDGRKRANFLKRGPLPVLVLQ